MKPIRILLADDHELVRAGIRALLESRAQFEVVGEANTGKAALEMAERLKPEVVLMDLMMPELNGLDATARIKEALPRVRVIILSVNASKPYVLNALRAGASGYLLKNVSPAELDQAIHAVMRDEVHLSSAVSRHVVAGFLQKTDPDDPAAKLTPRQREVLQLVAEGCTSKEIAKKLGISVKTAEMHRANLMKALDIHDLAGLIRFAIQIGLIEIQS